MFSIVEFCRWAGICRSTFYALQSRGEGPQITRLGGRRLIRRETAQAWALKREQETAVAQRRA